MSLLLLFNGADEPISRDGSAIAAVGAMVRAMGGKAAQGSARAAAGVRGTAIGTRSAAGSAHAAGGGYALARISGHAGVGAARGAGGFYARGSGGKGVGGAAHAAGGAYARARVKPLRIGIPLARLTRVVLFIDPSEVAFTEQGTDSDNPLLIAIDEVRISARAGTVSGIGSTEATVAKVSLDNADGRALDLVGYPLRVRAELYDHEDLFFVGTVTDFEQGLELNLTIQA